MQNLRLRTLQQILFSYLLCHHDFCDNIWMEGIHKCCRWAQTRRPFCENCRNPHASSSPFQWKFKWDFFVLLMVEVERARNPGQLWLSYTNSGNNTGSWFIQYTVKKVIGFPSPAGKSLTKLSLDGNYSSLPVQGEFGYSDFPALWRENR